MKPLGLSKLGIHTNRKFLRVFGVATAVGTAVCAWKSQTRVADGLPSQANITKLPAPAVDALAGALGEVAQILVLYPLDTIKVRCQATGDTANVVVRRLFKRGFTSELLRKLYAGALGAAACAVVIGAVHYASFEVARKTLLKLVAPRGAPQLASTPVTPSPSFPPANDPDNGSSGAPGVALSEPRALCSIAAALEHLDLATAVPIIPSGVLEPSDSLVGSPGLTQHQQHSTGGAELGDGASSTARALLVTFGAAAVAAVATALVESPVELFRHNAQAGHVPANFLREMLHTVRREGPGGLYWGFLPHCFEAWPHDISELATYGCMRDFEAAARSPASPHAAWMGRVSAGAWDLVTGAASGAAAVVVSMPFDTVKTYLQTNNADLSGRGLLGSAALFARSARLIVRRKGPGGLYVGVTPRLLQQVPSAMVCWWAIAAVKRAMAPYTESEEEGAAGGAGGHGTH